MNQVRFREWTCDVRRGTYGNGRTALQLVDAEDGGPVATCTVNLPDEPLGENEIFVKSYGENTGLLESLTEAEIVEPTDRVVVSGYVTVPVCRLKGGCGCP